jgi:hypothetical protein
MNPMSETGKPRRVSRDPLAGRRFFLLGCLLVSACGSDATPLALDAAVDGTSADALADGPVADAPADPADVRSDDAVTGDALAFATFEGACMELSTAFCDRLDGCAPFQVTLQFGSSAVCRQRVEAFCLRSTGAPGARVLPAALGQCARALADQNKSTCREIELGKPFESCVSPGIRVSGVACAIGSQCVSGYCPATARCGACTERAMAAGPCTSIHDCAPGLACGPSGACVEPAEEKGSCDINKPCEWGLVCIGGRCVNARALGEPCERDECNLAAGQACVTGSSGKTCAPVTAAAEGAPCGPDHPGQICASGGLCASATGTCLLPAADGQPCGEKHKDRHCLWPARCEDAICVLPSVNRCF